MALQVEAKAAAVLFRALCLMAGEAKPVPVTLSPGIPFLAYSSNVSHAVSWSCFESVVSAIVAGRFDSPILVVAWATEACRDLDVELLLCEHRYDPLLAATGCCR